MCAAAGYQSSACMRPWYYPCSILAVRQALIHPVFAHPLPCMQSITYKYMLYRRSDALASALQRGEYNAEFFKWAPCVLPVLCACIPLLVECKQEPWHGLVIAMLQQHAPMQLCPTALMHASHGPWRLAPCHVLPCNAGWPAHLSSSSPTPAATRATQPSSLTRTPPAMTSTFLLCPSHGACECHPISHLHAHHDMPKCRVRGWCVHP